MLWVWPPQTSISTQWRVIIRRISSANPFAMASRRYSSRYFIVLLSSFGVHARFCVTGIQLIQLLHFLQHAVSIRSLFFIHFTEGKSHMHQDILTKLHIGGIFQAHL